MKRYVSESVFHDWVLKLPFQQQALLTTSMRGPDHNNKFNSAKSIVRYMRGVVMKPAGKCATRPDGSISDNNNDFMWGAYVTRELISNGLDEDDHSYKWKYEEAFTNCCNTFWIDHDEYPHHFIMHLVHCAEVIAYNHPDEGMRQYWLKFYLDACNQFHMNPETNGEMNGRLDDSFNDQVLKHRELEPTPLIPEGDISYFNKPVHKGTNF